MKEEKHEKKEKKRLKEEKKRMTDTSLDLEDRAVESHWADHLVPLDELLARVAEEKLQLSEEENRAHSPTRTYLMQRSERNETDRDILALPYVDIGIPDFSQFK